jgi:hypothetical protein
MIGICFLDLDANNLNPAPSAACEPAVNSSIASRTKKRSLQKGPPAKARKIKSYECPNLVRIFCDKTC